MQEENYTFVTIDNEDEMLLDAVIIDVDDTEELSDFVMIDDTCDTDVITLSDDIVMFSDAETPELYAIDMDMDGGDISFII